MPVIQLGKRCGGIKKISLIELKTTTYITEEKFDFVNFAFSGPFGEMILFSFQVSLMALNCVVICNCRKLLSGFY